MFGLKANNRLIRYLSIDCVALFFNTLVKAMSLTFYIGKLCVPEMIYRVDKVIKQLQQKFMLDR